MTQEQKAKAYDEALKRAKFFHWNCPSEPERKKLEKMFPVLRESKDDRIRKSLIKFLTDIKESSESGRTTWAVRKEDAEMCKSFLVWLKKQKECVADNSKTSTDEDERIINQLITLVNSAGEVLLIPTNKEELVAWLNKYKESLHIPETCKENADSFADGIIEVRSFQRGMEEGRRLEKQKEQKPVECIEFDNEFEKQVSHLLASVLNGEWEYDEGFVKHAAQSLLGYAKNEMKPDEWDKREKLFSKALQTANAQIGQLFEENQKLKEQKPEWSEEDRIMLNDIIRCLPSKSSAEFNQKRVNWLKSLPERFNLQPKQKWSEEDEKTINDACCWIAEYAGYLMNKNYGKASMLMGLTDKLKSLRSSWKPNEEQMEALDKARRFIPYNCDVLESLYVDLKKL